MTLGKSSRGLLTHKMKGSGSMALFCLDVQNPTVRIHSAQMFWLIGSPERGDLCFSTSVTKRPRNYVYATEQLSDYYRKTATERLWLLMATVFVVYFIYINLHIQIYMCVYAYIYT